MKKKASNHLLLVILTFTFPPLVFSSGQDLNNQLTYWNAIEDASVVEPSERLELKAINTHNVKAVIWTPKQYAGSYVPGKETTISWGDLWITLVPEVRKECGAFNNSSPDGDLNLRIEQLLGLPPTGEDRVFVTLQVEAQDIFRPCAQPDIDTTRCNPVPDGYHMSEEHAGFYASQTMNSYKKNGYPWTRLGYTYDWNPNTGDYGASEYVVRKGSVVKVLAVTETEGYCTKS